MTKIWAIKVDTPEGEVVLSQTAVCDKHKTSDYIEDKPLVDCSDNKELECQVCGSRSTAYVLRTVKLVIQDVTDEIADLESLIASGNHALGVIAMLNCNLAHMIFTLAKCVEQLASDQL